MEDVALIFPTCLSPEKINPLLGNKKWKLFFIEEETFFGNEKKMKFNKKKLILYRASMKELYERLKKKGYHNLKYLNYHNENGGYVKEILKEKPKRIHSIDVSDFALEDYLKKKFGNKMVWHSSPLFICSRADLGEFSQEGRGKHDKFYRWQRERLGILMNKSGGPEGGEWSYDPENREALPAKGIEIPDVPRIKMRKSILEAIKYVEYNFESWLGSVNNFNFPVERNGAKAWLRNFVRKRLRNFGRFQDAIEPDEPYLFHSVVSPLINIGLLTPMEIVKAVLKSKAPIESKEGYVRQIIGWREYMRMIYLLWGRKMRKMNYFGNKRRLGPAWYKGTTGIVALDDTIKMAFHDAYIDHIKRLMIVANLMNLCGIRPDDVYRWFMEFSADSYDWVMVGNVYGMGLYADGGMVASKPYIASSAYLVRMSRGYGKDKGWDALFWNFVAEKEKKLEKNGRVKQLVGFWKKKSLKEKKEYQSIAREIIRRITK